MDEYTETQIKELAEVAESARVQHWGPYSNFSVVAAVETVYGRIYGGSNVENAALSMSIHAEMNAIMAAMHDGALTRSGSRKFIKAVYTNYSPCGLCRQAIQEFATDDCIVICEQDDRVWQMSLSDLMPHAFGPDDLGVE